MPHILSMFFMSLTTMQAKKCQTQETETETFPSPGTNLKTDGTKQALHNLQKLSRGRTKQTTRHK